MTRDIGSATREELIQAHRKALEGKTLERQKELFDMWMEDREWIVIHLLNEWWRERKDDDFVMDYIKGWDQGKRLHILNDN